MSFNIAVDVLIPSLDRPEELQRALESVDRVQQAESQLDLRVHVVDREAGSAAGAAAARNIAAAQGKAPYIAFLDDDDQWLSPRLTRAVEILEGEPRVALVAGQAKRTSGGSFLPSSLETEEDRDHAALALDCFVCTSTVTLRRRDYEAVGGMDEELERAEDYALWLRLTRDGGQIRLLPAELALYSDNTGGLSEDPVEMARASLEALRRSAQMPTNDRAWRSRVGRLEAVLSHGLSKDGKFSEALQLSRRALVNSPTARVAWTSSLRALLRLRR
jgi:glycosyltransferase involved in cell wall biosynthesis